MVYRIKLKICPIIPIFDAHKNLIFRDLGSRLPILFSPFGSRTWKLKSPLAASGTSQAFAIIRRINFADISGKNVSSYFAQSASHPRRSALPGYIMHVPLEPRPSLLNHSRSRATCIYVAHTLTPHVCVCVRGVRACVRRAGDRSNGAEADSYYSRDLK